MMMKKVVCIYITGLLLLSNHALAQGNEDTIAKVNTQDLLVSYELDISSNRKNGLAESYNGAIKTIFLSHNKARVRLVSLMRVQSIFYSGNPENGTELITIVKESGKDSYKKRITKQQWAVMNKKYDAAEYSFEEDSIVVLDYKCKKVVVKLKEGKKITAYYTTQLDNDLFKQVEPAFAGVPGIVLKYEYENKQAKFIYTASNISLSPTDPGVYKIP
jgi:GLPGLI family protein